MLKNYFKTILRNIQRNKIFTAINVVGLSLGLAAFIAISEYVKYETSFENYNSNAGQIIRLGMETNLGGNEIAVPFFGPPVAKTVKDDFPEVVESTRLYGFLRREYFVKFKDVEVKEPNMTRLFGDPNFFDFFSIPLILGDQSKALAEPNAVVISESTAARYFGSNWKNQDVLGQLIEVQDLEKPLQITGVSEDVPSNTHFTYNFLISMTTLGAEESDTHWLSNSFYHYLQLRSDAQAVDLMEKIEAKSSLYLASDMRDFLGTTYAEYFAQEGSYFRFFHQPLESIHLDSNYELELAVNGDRTYVNIFRIVSILVLIMAAINFMNLSTVAGLKRHKEVGVRKVLGSLKVQLIFQFLFESVLIVFTSLLLAITTIQLTAPIVNGTVGIDIIPSLASMVPTIVQLSLGAVMLGIISGLYPSMILASFNVTQALKGGKTSGSKSRVFRSTLIIFQFAISLLLTIGVSGIYQQIDLMRSQDLGYAKDQIMLIDDVDQLGADATVFRDRLRGLASVDQTALSGFVPIGTNEYGVSGYNAVNDPNDQTLRMKSAWVDEYYLETYNIELIAGRNFSPSSFSDAESIIVNEQFLKSWNWSLDEVIGKQITNVGNKQALTVIGVVKDFQLTSLKERILPFFFEYQEADRGLSVKFSGKNWEEVRAQSEEVWSQFTDKPFSYTFVDQLFESAIQTEQQAGRLFSLFSVLAGLIGALGLLGVASFVIVQRTKEVGIRKVLGATMPQLFLTLSKSFVWLIGIAGLVAFPIAYYFLKDWLNQYVYQIELSWLLFVFPFALVMFIAMMIVGTQVFKVALVNPIKSLRYE